LLAIVLSGGGAKGAYQQGVWKALRKLRIKYDIVTGTSIGAMNGMMMVQNEYYRCSRLWKTIEFNKIFDNFNSTQDDMDMYKTYLGKIIEGGIDTSRIEKLIAEYYKPKKIYNSKISFGVVAYNVSTRQVHYATTNNTRPDRLKHYILASATCFPLFKPTKIGQDILIDGGYYDNLPINLAIDLGATDIIAVDLQAVGLRKRIRNKDVNVKYITPKNKLDSFLKFESTAARKMIDLGYNDAMKSFEKLDGNLYTFKKGTINNLLKKYKNKMLKIVEEINCDSIILKRLTNSKTQKEAMLTIMEDTLEVLNFLPHKIYTLDINKKIFDKFDSLDDINDDLSIDDIKKILDRKIIIKYIYNKLKKCDKIDYIIFNIFSKEFTIAVYLLAMRSW